MASAAIAGGQAMMIQGQLNFSRDMEREADRIGYGVFADAGFAPAGMAAMFDKMDNASRLTDSGSFPYLRSHPLTVERLAEARSRLPLEMPGNVVRTNVHELMRGRAVVLMEPNVMAWRRHADRPLASVLGEPLAAGRLYAAALAASMLREPATADAALAELRRDARLAADPQASAVVTLLAAEILLARGDAVGALEQLATLPPTFQARPEMFLRAKAAQRAVEGGAADRRSELREQTQRLQSWVAVQRRDAAAWELLGHCQETLGFHLRALRAQAEARAAIGDLGSAIDRLRAAQAVARREQPVDHVEASVIDSRLRELTAVRRQLAAELRGQRDPGREPE
jgi:predicted Zn-dependent protease